MLRRYNTALYFYLGFAPAGCWLISIACAVVTFLKGPVFIEMMLTLKLITFAILIPFVNSVKKKELFFYYNMHLQLKMLWSIALVADLSIFTLLQTIACAIR